MNSTQKIRNNQSGLVSIVIALVIMSIMTLVAVSFAFLTRREQRQALDRQLSSQAFYAAETGINDAVTGIKNGQITTDITDCTSPNTAFSERQLDGAGGLVSYTCVLVDRSPTSLEYNRGISEDSSTVVRIQTPQNVRDLKISWEAVNTEGFTNEQFASTGYRFYLPQARTIRDEATGAFFSTIAGAQTAAFPNHIGMLRATIIPTNSASSTDSLLENAQTIFLYPEQHANDSAQGTVSFRNTQQISRDGVFGSGECHVNNGAESADPESFPRDCNTVVTGIDSSDFYLRLRSIYQPVAVTITARGSTNNILEISGAQAVIDATGKANDVLRRIQVRVPYRDDYYFPEFAIESAQTICKRIRVASNGVELQAPQQTHYFYDAGNAFSGGESNDFDGDQESCRLPDTAKPY